jgi:hypothetical protein
MKNKFLITVIIPEIEEEYDIYIPNNKKVGTIKQFILEAVVELSDNLFNKSMDDVRMIDRNTSIEYDNNLLIKDTSIKNGSRLIFL